LLIGDGGGSCGLPTLFFAGAVFESPPLLLLRKYQQNSSAVSSSFILICL
jgi:hypothetical protein